MQTRRIIIIFISLLWSVAGFSQADLTIHNMQIIPQAQYQNPSLMPLYKINIGLPVISSVYGHITNSGFKYKDLIRKDGDSLYIDVDNMFDKLAKTNFVTVATRIDLLHFGMRIKEDNYFSFHITENALFRFTYPEDLLKLAIQGNARFLGETADLSKLAIDLQHYREFAATFARVIDEQWTVGGSVKYLYGMENIYTPKGELTLHTNEESFDLTANADVEIRTAGIPVTITEDTIIWDSTYLDDFGKLITGKGNHGFAFDLGGKFQITEELQVNAAVLDLGMIRWKEFANRVVMKDASFLFQGLEIADIFGADSLDLDSIFTDLTDSLAEEFDYTTEQRGYWAPTFSRFNIGGTYKFHENMNAGLLFTGEFYKGVFRPKVTASFNTRFSRWFSGSVSYTYANRDWTNVGVGFAVNAGPIQLYVVNDNILGPLWPQAMKTAHTHFGINITAGWPDKDRDGDGIPDKADRCPDDPGPEEYLGCPDTDEDGIVDVDDNCPEIPGLPEFFGCPDSDGDGLTDSLDACPLTPGVIALAGCPDMDNDSIIDSEDDCPEIWGPKETNGCPDMDGDGILDMDDACPEKPGLVEHQGCPDTDQDGLFDNEDKCVEVFGPMENAGCPWGDLDGDGIFDKEDRCVDTPGPRENQGCPYGDLDGDGVTDDVDECPNTPGPVENNGCPVIEEAEQEIINTAFSALEFQSGKAIIRATSYESLDSLASLLSRKPEWNLHLEGHTDNVGSEATNLRLSKNRAIAVKDYINLRGIHDEKRFDVEWFGEEKPIYPNNTAEGRQKNRRVEMEIVFE